MPLFFGAIAKVINGIRKNKKLNKLISKLEEIDTSSIKYLISDRDYAEIYLKQLEYFDLKKRLVSAETIINKNKEIIQKMEEYINKQRELLSKENATQLDIAKLVSSLQKIQLGQDYFAAGIIECDDSLTELTTHIDSLENQMSDINMHLKDIENISKEVLLIQHRLIKQDAINSENKDMINNIVRIEKTNIDDLRNVISTLDRKIVSEMELLNKQLYSSINIVKEQIDKNKVAIKEEIHNKNTEVQKQIEYQNGRILSITNSINSLITQVKTFNSEYYENKRITDAKIISFEDIIANMSTEYKKQIFRMKSYLVILFIISIVISIILSVNI